MDLFWIFLACAPHSLWHGQPRDTDSATWRECEFDMQAAILSLSGVGGKVQIRAAAVPEVRLVSTKRTQQVVRVTKKSFLVGSGANADALLHDKAVAAEHARFDWRDTRLFLTALESEAGTTYDGNRLMPGVAYVVGNNALVCFGSPDQEFRVEQDLQKTASSNSLDQALANAFLAKFQASGNADVKRALEDQQL